MGVVWPSIFGPSVCGAGLWVRVYDLVLGWVDCEPLRAGHLTRVIKSMLSVSVCVCVCTCT